MRDIKFRVWSNVKGGWIHNALLLACIDGMPFAHLIEKLEDGQVKHHIYNASNLDCVIEQYTGLKDKNGKDIYEGDILQHTENKNTYFVRWANDMEYAGWSLAKGQNDIGELFLYKNFVNLEVVGNIHQNPELLK